MLFAAYTPYTPPRKSTSPWMIIAGICGGCLAIALIGAFVVSYVVIKKFGPVMQRSISATQFLACIKLHNYAKAETFLAPSAQAKYGVDWLARQETDAEKELGTLQNSVLTAASDRVKTANDFTRVVDLPFTLLYVRGTRKVILHYEPGVANNKIADIQWNAEASDTQSSAASTASAPAKSHTKH